jgi:hypothetical protein
MPKKITPKEVAKQVDYNLGEAADFAADLLEYVNDHSLSAALRAVNADEYDLACEFIQLEKEQMAAGYQTEPLLMRRNALMVRLAKALEGA